MSQRVNRESRVARVPDVDWRRCAVCCGDASRVPHDLGASACRLRNGTAAVAAAVLRAAGVDAAAIVALVRPRRRRQPRRTARAPSSTAGARAPPRPTAAANLAALGDGTLDAFHGLGRCGRVDAEGTLGDSGATPSQFEKLGEYRVFSGGGRNALVYFLADDIRVVELLYPKLPRPLVAQLGTPERKVKSELSPQWEQWIWATRGLTAHVQRSTGQVTALFAYSATSVDAFLGSDVARVSKSEAPLEELR